MWRDSVHGDNECAWWNEYLIDTLYIEWSQTGHPCITKLLQKDLFDNIGMLPVTTHNGQLSH